MGRTGRSGHFRPELRYSTSGIPFAPSGRTKRRAPPRAWSDGRESAAARTLDRNSQMGQSLEQDPEALTILQAPMPQRKRANATPRGRRKGPARAQGRTSSVTGVLAVRDGFFRDMVRGLQNGVLAVTADGRIAVMNEVACRILGIEDRPADIGRPFTTVLRSQPDVVRIAPRSRRRCRRTFRGFRVIRTSFARS
jgi:PAS domain-containing protein